MTITIKATGRREKAVIDVVFGGTVLLLAGIFTAMRFHDRTRAERLGLLFGITGCTGLGVAFLAGAPSTVTVAVAVGALVLSLIGLLNLGRVRSVVSG